MFQLDPEDQERGIRYYERDALIEILVRLKTLVQILEDFIEVFWFEYTEGFVIYWQQTFHYQKWIKSQKQMREVIKKLQNFVSYSLDACRVPPPTLLKEPFMIIQESIKNNNPYPYLSTCENVYLLINCISSKFMINLENRKQKKISQTTSLLFSIKTKFLVQFHN